MTTPPPSDAPQQPPAAVHPTRFRPRRAQPWNIGSIIPWGTLATIGDPLLIALPLVGVLLATFAVLGIEVPARAETLVPAWSLPPFGAYQDAGAVGLATEVPALVWLGRSAFLLFRACLFGVVAHVALQRTDEASPRLGPALDAVRASLPVLLVLELASWAVFAIPLVLGQGSILDPGRPVSQLGLLIGQALLVNAYFAALDGAGLFPALRTGLRWVTDHPLGHLATVVAATAASNGIVWLAGSGEVGPPRPLPLALYACVHALVATTFCAALARRYRLLYAR